MEVQEKLTCMLKESGHGPFLFIGSGISRRYLQLESWPDLLKLFCNNIADYQYYYSKSNSNLPRTASAMADDYLTYWWNSPDMELEREKFKSITETRSSPLKISISEYVKSRSKTKIEVGTPYFSEIAELKSANIDGIITTNWDMFIENIFPGYKVFVGQEELLISTPQNMGEIYKIHGCCTQPNSLILTDEDYSEFEMKNPYLAAKLVTIFIENPVIFMGYSLHDPNIISLLSSIVRGIGKDNIRKITDNLIFVQREAENRPYGTSQTIYSLGEVDLPVTHMVTSDFEEVYKALQSVERKIPARILRHCKEQIYNLVKETNPSNRLCVVDVEDLDDSSNIDFVVGVGIREKLEDKGYRGLNLVDIFNDVLKDSQQYDAENLLKVTIPELEKKSKYIPIFTYLKSIGITCPEEYESSSYDLRSIREFEIDDFRYQQYRSYFLRECDSMNVGDIAQNYECDKAAFLIPYIPMERICLDELKEFIIEHISKVEGKNSRYSTQYRKLICIYDLKKNGWLPQVMSV